METTKETDRAKEQARAQLNSISEMLDCLKDAEEEKDSAEYDRVREEIQQNALEVGKLNQYFILLCTGGPAVRIKGNLDEHGEPESAELQYQDWFSPWTEYKIGQAEEETLLEYARHYYFGE